MPKINIDPIPRKIQPVFFVVDTSGGRETIGARDQLLEACTYILKDIDSHSDVHIQIAILKYGTCCDWVTAKGLEDIEKYQHIPIIADGLSELGAALNELNSRLSRKYLNSEIGYYPPSIFFITDGYATDNYKKALEKINTENKWFKISKTVCFSTCDNVNRQTLEELCGIDEFFGWPVIFYDIPFGDIHDNVNEQYTTSEIFFSGVNKTAKIVDDIDFDTIYTTDTMLYCNKNTIDEADTSLDTKVINDGVDETGGGYSSTTETAASGKADESTILKKEIESLTETTGPESFTVKNKESKELYITIALSREYVHISKSNASLRELICRVLPYQQLHPTMSMIVRDNRKAISEDFEED